MLKKFTARGTALVASIALLGGAAFVASGTTGAYFSDTKQGVVTGSIGSIAVGTAGGSGAAGLDLAFSKMLPGEAQTVSANYRNTGNTAQDVYIVFNNATALSTFNNLGSYGEAHLSANGAALFDSVNLNDRAATCGTFAPTGCWPLKSQYLLASNVPVNGTGTVSLTFNYASKMKGAPAAFNSYPASTQQYSDTLNSSDQTTVKAADGAGTGLPYQIVATQLGVAPGQ
ncbi:hypothetical protein [Marisediminicola antarctica]|nr:hypothetical protein [Marisediminicola antarctica]